MWIVSGFEKGRISVASVGYSVFGSDIDKFAYNSTGYGIKISIDDVFKFFMFNRKRGNRIYSCDEFSITDEMQEIASRFKANRVEIDSLLTYDVTHDVGKKNVATGGYVVAGEGQSHGERYIELTVKGQDYTYRYNVYSYNPRFEKGRSTARAGWESNQTIYRVDAKTCVRLHNIFDENAFLYKDALETLKKFYKDEQINPK